MDFVKYMHLERLGNDEVDGITEGVVYAFPKLDFKRLQRLTISKVKEIRKGLF